MVAVGERAEHALVRPTGTPARRRWNATRRCCTARGRVALPGPVAVVVEVVAGRRRRPVARVGGEHDGVLVERRLGDVVLVAGAPGPVRLRRREHAVGVAPRVAVDPLEQPGVHHRGAGRAASPLHRVDVAAEARPRSPRKYVNSFASQRPWRSSVSKVSGTSCHGVSAPRSHQNGTMSGSVYDSPSARCGSSTQRLARIEGDAHALRGRRPRRAWWRCAA